MIEVYRFALEKAERAHENTIWAAPVIEGSIRPPFNHAWGYLDTKTVMDKHAHAHEEVYFVFEGEGFAVVGDERKPVGPGDVINIPSNVPHTMENAKDAPFLWAAFWWNRDQDAPALRRTKAKAEAAAKELHDIVERFAASGWDLIAAPAKAWLEGEENQDALVKAIEQADAQCGSCGCELDALYKRALELKALL